MSKASISRSPKPKSASAKELKLKVDELTEEVERLRTENDEIKTKFQMICKKIVDNIDLSEYAFIDPNIEPYMIDIRDLFHMIQKLSLLAATTNSSDKIESHMERLETRITELANENSDYIKNKLKLHERLEFIMQERDVWKRNAETLKAMYSKLAKQHQSESLLTINKVVVGAQTANIDAKKPNARVFKANIPKNFNENLLNYQNIDKKLEKKITEINLNQQKILAASQANENYFQKNFNIEDSLKHTNNLENLVSNQFSNTASESNKSFESTENNSTRHLNTNRNISTEVVTTEPIERPMTSTMSRRVSFNKEIDPLTATPIPCEITNNNDLFITNRSIPNSAPAFKQSNENENYTSNAGEVQAQIRNLLSKRNSIDHDKAVINEINTSLNLLKNMSMGPVIDTRFSNRASICSNRKYPGDTPVKDLEPTLKMIIIKELSVEKVDGNDWRMFAHKIGISEQEIDEWKSLKLQYPMARVLSFWSSRPDATTRLLHRHLNASCFNYASLAKRIENFYDVM